MDGGWVLDSSSLISLSRAGLLPMLDRLPQRWVLLDVVWQESVVEAERAGHVDAAALRGTLTAMRRRKAPSGSTVDARVLAAASRGGTLVSNDLALGRRGRNLGIRWLRTADLVLLLVSTGTISRDDAEAALTALADAGRISADLADDYRRELP